MSSFGYATLGQVGGSIQVSSDGRPEMKAGGITLDWSAVTAVSADTEYEDGVTVLSGEKALRYGQVVVIMGVAEVQTVTYTGGPTAGAATITLPAAGGEPAQTAAAVDFNVSAAAMQDALEALSRIGPNGVTVTRTGAGTNGDPYIYTLTFARGLGNVPQLTSTHTFTGGTTPTTTHATGTAGTGGGLYGPYDPAASDGRQTISRGTTFIVNNTVKETDLKSDHPPVLDGGRCFKDRILATDGTPAASLAAGPTFTNLYAALPRLAMVTD